MTSPPAQSFAIPPGVYLVSEALGPADLERGATQRNWRFFYLDGAAIKDKSSFLAAVARLMQFPDYFGGNWNALEECIRDLDWLPAAGYLIFYDSADTFASHDPINFETALDIFRSAVEYWQEQDRPFYVLLRGKKETLAPLQIPAFGAAKS